MNAPRSVADRLPPPLPPPTYAAAPPPPTYSPPPPPPPAGWYHDPGRRHEYRFWNGWGWTPGVADGGRVLHDFPVAHAPSKPWEGVPGPDERAALPRVAVAYAFAGIVAAIVGSFLGAGIAGALAPHSRLALLVLSQSGLWSGLVGAVWLVSRKFGTGNVWRDFGLRAEGMDVPRGALVSVIARFAGIVAVIPLVAISHKLIGSDVTPLKGATQSPALLVTLVLMVVVGAPLIEELFFRGLLLRSLVPSLGTLGAIVTQGLVFGSLHMRPSYGLGNVSLFVVIGAMGIIQGIVAERYRRLGPGIFSHAFFNLVAVLLALSLHALG